VQQLEARSAIFQSNVDNQRLNRSCDEKLACLLQGTGRDCLVAVEFEQTGHRRPHADVVVEHEHRRIVSHASPVAFTFARSFHL
jgi:hypothetical protein